MCDTLTHESSCAASPAPALHWPTSAFQAGRRARTWSQPASSAGASRPRVRCRHAPVRTADWDVRTHAGRRLPDRARAEASVRRTPPAPRRVELFRRQRLSNTAFGVAPYPAATLMLGACCRVPSPVPRRRAARRDQQLAPCCTERLRDEDIESFCLRRARSARRSGARDPLARPSARQLQASGAIIRWQQRECSFAEAWSRRRCRNATARGGPRLAAGLGAAGGAAAALAPNATTRRCSSASRWRSTRSRSSDAAVRDEVDAACLAPEGARPLRLVRADGLPSR